MQKLISLSFFISTILLPQTTIPMDPKLEAKKTIPHVSCEEPHGKPLGIFRGREASQSTRQASRNATCTTFQQRPFAVPAPLSKAPAIKRLADQDKTPISDPHVLEVIEKLKQDIALLSRRTFYLKNVLDEHQQIFDTAAILEEMSEKFTENTTTPKPKAKRRRRK